MRIEDFRSEKRGNRTRVAATVTWEDCDRQTQELYFETDEAFAHGLSCNPHAFLVASIMPALRHGEERVFVDAEICPELRSGLVTAMSLVRHWFYKPDRELVRIEAKTQSRVPASHMPERAGFFFSGGIDSMATLRANRLNFPLEHPGSLKDAFLVYGLDVGTDGDEFEIFEYVMNSLSAFAQEAGITLIPVYTNVYTNHRHLDQNWDFWLYEFQASALAAVAHAFTEQVSSVSIASTLDILNPKPEGSHPLLDPNYSSHDMRIRHDGAALSRLGKVELVAGWDLALQYVRVCMHTEQYRPDMLNCGECEKCIRTMLELLAVGALDRAGAFPRHDVSEEMVRTRVRMPKAYFESFYGELVEPLAERGRHDLVRAIKYNMDRYQGRKRGVKAKVRQFDSKYLHGSLKRVYTLIRG
jgi:hypothetical protein